jgi:hypothetical protein
MKEELQDLSNELFKKAELRSHLDCLTKERILFTILTAKEDTPVSEIVKLLTDAADEVLAEQKKLEGLVRTLAMEGPNQFDWVYYKPTCKFGYENCIHDPAYIYSTYPEWYKELYGDKSPEEAAIDEEEGCVSCTEDNCYYDDEDK